MHLRRLQQSCLIKSPCVGKWPAANRFTNSTGSNPTGTWPTFAPWLQYFVVCWRHNFMRTVLLPASRKKIKEESRGDEQTHEQEDEQAATFAFAWARRAPKNSASAVSVFGNGTGRLEAPNKGSQRTRRRAGGHSASPCRNYFGGRQGLPAAFPKPKAEGHGARRDEETWPRRGGGHARGRVMKVKHTADGRRRLGPSGRPSRACSARRAGLPLDPLMRNEIST